MYMFSHSDQMICTLFIFQLIDWVRGGIIHHRCSYE